MAKKFAPLACSFCLRVLALQFFIVWFLCSYINGVAEAAKKSPELIQLLELHTQFASITPYAQVRLAYMALELFSNSRGAIQFQRGHLSSAPVYFPKI